MLHCSIEIDQQLTGRAIRSQSLALEAEGPVISVGFGPVPGAPRELLGATGLQHVADTRVWWRKPNCWREDASYRGGGTVITVDSNARSMNYISWLNVAYISTHETLVRPSSLVDLEDSILADRLSQAPLLSVFAGISDWTVETLGTEHICGYEGLSVKAQWTQSDESPTIWPYATEFEAVLLPERGVVLRFAGLIEGQKVGVITARSIQFDAEVPDTIFAYAPPPHTKLIREP